MSPAELLRFSPRGRCVAATFFEEGNFGVQRTNLGAASPVSSGYLGAYCLWGAVSGLQLLWLRIIRDGLAYL